ncbi:MAG: hypothetical protein CMC13_16760 [Flavobacteriaceae bacterium]|nr:hypothetical protein [Flavobacteriaceae bacterium]|tara:strand:+ start:394 stop:1866 length:1473 start_codon:yes stop_codon:yes gene_type:complete
MKRLLISLLCVCTAAVSTCQIEITNIVHQSTNGLSITNGFALTATGDTGFSAFLMDGRKIYANGFDADYNYLGRLDTREISLREEYIAGKHYGDAYNLFFKVRTGNAIMVQQFNFADSTVTDKSVPLDIRDEEILQAFEHDKKLYLLNVAASEDKLYLHSIDENLNPFSKEVAVPYTFYNDNQRERAFHKLIFDDFQEISGIGMHPSQARFPMTLPESTRPTKIYKKGDHLIFTLDFSPLLTQIMTVNITSGATTFKEIPNLAGTDKKSVDQSNSFLLDQQLFQIVRHDDELQILVTDTETGTLLNSFSISDENETFNYTNTATLTLKPSKKKRKEVSTKQFLRYAKNDPLGIYATKVDEGVEITYGTWDKERGNNRSLNNTQTTDPMVGIMTMTAGAAGGLLYLALSSGNSIQSYGMHHLGMTTRAIGVFDENINHLPEKGVQATIYHKIDYYNYRKEGTTPMLLFEFRDAIIYGSFYPEQNAIKFLKF